MKPKAPLSKNLKAYLAQIGSRGGKKSKRSLDPAQARRMVALREARKAYREHHLDCFWSYKPEHLVRYHDIPWVIDGLMCEGNRLIFEKARRIRRLLKEPPCH
ncbi:MAG: hypothetical protein HC904_13415 [Blastochloris sp.]|nr:hypothetical protein [Blastochloris sp.]